MAQPLHLSTMTKRHPHGITLDAELVDRARAGDRAAFATLYEVTLDAVTRYVAVRMRDRDHDAVGNLVHDAYCFAWPSRPSSATTRWAPCCASPHER